MELLLLIGIIITILGAFFIVKSIKEANKKLIRAVVQSCSESYIHSVQSGEKGYEVIVDVPSPYGTTYKTFMSNRPYNQGDIIDAYYDVHKDEFELVKKSKKGVWAYWVLIAGLLWSALIGLCMWMEESPNQDKIIVIIVACLLCMFFVVVGFYFGIIKPIKRKMEMVNCHTVQGSIIDFTTSASHNVGLVYFPIYGFTYNGKEMRIKAISGSNDRSNTEIGKPVNIVINRETEEMYCLEDSKSSRNVGILLIVLGVFFLSIIVVWEYFSRMYI